MPTEPTTWRHVSGHRFQLRRIECALLGEDLYAVGRRRGALAVGCALAIVVVLASVLLALQRPQAGLGDAQIVMGQASGALYVRVGDTWHPVLNLASARLIAATNADPRPVRESELTHTKRGALLGIPGAPQLLAQPLAISESAWTICDNDNDNEAATTVLVGTAADSSVRRVAADRALLVTPPSGSPAYLLLQGRRAVVDMADAAVRHALHLPDRTPTRVSQTLLNAVPEAPPIAAPRISGAGAPAGSWLPGFPVGSVLGITRASGAEYYVVLTGGIQRIGQVAADLLRFRDSQGSTHVVAVAPDVIRAAPMFDGLPVSGFPDQAPSEIIAEPTTCVTWTPAAAGPADIAFLSGTGRPLPPGRQPVALAQADGRGPAVDAVYLPPGRSAYVTSRSLFGDNSRAATRYLITDTGVRFAIHDDDAAHALGLPSAAAPAPWPVLSALPVGLELSRERASVARDAVHPEP